MLTIQIDQLSNGEFSIKQWSATSIFPTSHKKTAMECVARIAQLLDIKQPVPPQDYPEIVCIGEIEINGGKK